MLSCTLDEHNHLTLLHLVLDLNGTLALDGNLLPGIAGRLNSLTPTLDIHLITADTQGTAAHIADELGIKLHVLEPGRGIEQKASFVRHLGQDHVIAMGNGANDAEMLHLAKLGIAVSGPEGLAIPALLQADIMVDSACDGLDLLLHPRRLLATLRT